MMPKPARRENCTARAARAKLGAQEFASRRRPVPVSAAALDFVRHGCVRDETTAVRETIMVKILTIALGALLLTEAALPALAQTWPAGPIKFVVPFTAGGSTDITARVLAENLRPLLGQTVLIENRPGAAGTIAGDTVAKSAPNGASQHARRYCE